MYRVDAVAMTLLPGAAPLAGATVVRSSVVAYRGSLYVGTDAGTFRLTDDGGALTVQAHFGEATDGSGFVDITAPGSPTLYAVTSDGAVYARNAVNFTPVASFGADGEAALPAGDDFSSSPYAVDGAVYVGGLSGKVYALRESDGQGAGPGGSPLFFDTGSGALSGGGVSTGLSAAPAPGSGWTIVFGARNGLYYQVRADDPATYRVTAMTNGISRPFNTVPSVDADTMSEFIGSDDGRLYRIPRF
jgi:outer membrane protein assembly factor BamB